jgi:NB-ARC domain
VIQANTVIGSISSNGHAAGMLAGASLEAPTGSAPERVHGRDDLLQQLRRGVRRPGGRMQVLTGLGGVGKSTVAVELYRWVKLHKKCSAWWISASDSDSLIEGLVSLTRAVGGNYGDQEAVRCNSGAAQDRVWQLLERTRRSWLLVFDNADDPSLLRPLDGTGWLRGSRRGLVLVTSRLGSGWQWGSEAAVHELTTLGEQDGARLLLDLAPNAGDKTDAQALAGRLGYLPLALHLAGAYLSSGFAKLNFIPGLPRGFGCRRCRPITHP